MLRRAAQELTSSEQQAPDMFRCATQELIHSVQQPNSSTTNPTPCQHIYVCSSQRGDLLRPREGGEELPGPADELPGRVEKTPDAGAGC